MVLGGGICVALTHSREVYNGPWRGHLCNSDTFHEVYNSPGRGHLCNIDTFQGGIQWSWAGASV